MYRWTKEMFVDVIIDALCHNVPLSITDTFVIDHKEKVSLTNHQQFCNWLRTLLDCDLSQTFILLKCCVYVVWVYVVCVCVWCVCVCLVMWFFNLVRWLLLPDLQWQPHQTQPLHLYSVQYIVLGYNVVEIQHLK